MKMMNENNTQPYNNIISLALSPSFSISLSSPLRHSHCISLSHSLSPSLSLHLSLSHSLSPSLPSPFSIALIPSA